MKDVSKASSTSEAPKAAGHVPKATGKELPKTPPKMAPKTPSAADRSVSPTLVDAAAAPTEPKPSGVDRAKESSPTRPLEGLPEQVPVPTTPSEVFRAAVMMSQRKLLHWHQLLLRRVLWDMGRPRRAQSLLHRHRRALLQFISNRRLLRLRSGFL